MGPASRARLTGLFVSSLAYGATWLGLACSSPAPASVAPPAPSSSTPSTPDPHAPRKHELDAGDDAVSDATRDAADVEAAPADAGPPFPIPDWPTGTPESQGISGAGLAAAASVAAADGSYCLLVIRHGVLVAESYWNGSDATMANPSWSIAKSYTSLLVGIALDRGDLASLDDSAAAYVPEWVGTDKAAITIRDLLSMTSGLSWNAFEDYVVFATLTSDQTAYAVAQSLAHAPGSNWTYDNAAVQVLEQVMLGATGMQLDEYAATYLWPKIGMASAHWAHDPSGGTTAYANVYATCRDHARMGYLMLHRGDWAGAQVVSRSYLDLALAPSQTLNGAYGFLFWVNAGTPALDAMMQPWPGTMVPFAPADLVAARGFGNQFIDVIPSLDLVVVRFGKDPLGDAPDGAAGGGSFDLGALITDSKFETHDAILKPILAAVL